MFRGRPGGILRARLSGVCLALACLASAGTVFADDHSPAFSVDSAALDPIVDGYIENGRLPFLYVRIEDEEGRLVYERSAQNAQFVPDATITGDSWLRIWSMSKIVTITAMLDMVEDGLIKFDDPVAKYIPEFAELMVAVDSEGKALSHTAYSAPDDETHAACPFETVPMSRAMTVRDLLNHEAGFFYKTGHECLNEVLGAQDLGHAADSQALIDGIAALPLIQQPGDGYFYGLNTTVLGLVMERAANKPLAQIIDERITGPLDITGLQYGKPEGVTLLPRFGGREGGLRVVEPNELDIFVGAPPDYDAGKPLYLGGEGMLGTAAAYADFLHMLLGRGEANGTRILNEETIELLTAAHTQLDSEYGHNGFNLWINSGLLGDGSTGVGGLWIGGGYEGTYFWVDPHRRLVGVIMTQVNTPPEGGDAKNDIIREAFYAALRSVPEEG